MSDGQKLFPANWPLKVWLSPCLFHGYCMISIDADDAAFCCTTMESGDMKTHLPAGWWSRLGAAPLCFPGTFELSKQHGENPHNLGGQQPPIAARKERHTAHRTTPAASSLLTAAPLEKVTTLQAVVLFCALWHSYPVKALECLSSK